MPMQYITASIGQYLRMVNLLNTHQAFKVELTLLIYTASSTPSHIQYHSISGYCRARATGL